MAFSDALSPYKYFDCAKVEIKSKKPDNVVSIPAVIIRRALIFSRVEWRDRSCGISGSRTPTMTKTSGTPESDADK